MADRPRGVTPEIHERFQRIWDRVTVMLESEQRRLREDPVPHRGASWSRRTAVAKRTTPRPFATRVDGPHGWDDF